MKTNYCPVCADDRIRSYHLDMSGSQSFMCLNPECRVTFKVTLLSGGRNQDTTKNWCEIEGVSP